MRALVVDPGSSSTVRFADVPEPEPRADQLVVEVHHIGLNVGEVMPGVWPEDLVHGHDASGVVVRAAADGTGPPTGTRVAVGFTPHAWAERVAVGQDSIATVPDAVDLADSAALAIAGVTALRVVRSRPLLGRRVLVTGAGGGVGRFAVQLAAAAGATVTAVVGSPERAAGLAELGADEVVTGVDGLDPGFELTVDTVGGAALADLLGLLGPGGAVHAVGTASGRATTFPPGSLFVPGAPRAIVTVGGGGPPGPELADLLALVGAGRLSPEIGWRGGWRRIDDAVASLRDRRVRGKVVLDVD